MFNNFFFENRAVCDIVLKDTVQLDRCGLFNDASIAKFTECC